MDPYFSQPQPLHLGQDNIHRPMDMGSQSDNAVSNPFGTASEMMEQSSTARYYDDAGLDVDGSFGGPNGLGNGYQDDDEGAAVRSSMADMHSPSAGYLGMESEMSMQVMDYSMDSNSYPSENDYQIDMSALASQQAMPFSDQYSATSPHFSTMTDNDNMMNPQHPSYSYRRSGSMSYPQIPELMHNTYTPSAQMARAIGSNPAVTAPHRQSGMGTSSMQRASQPRRPNLQSTNTTGMNSLTVKEENLSSPSSNTLSRAPSIQNQVYAGQTSMERSDSHPEQSMTTGDPTMTETLSKSASLAPPFPFVAKFGYNGPQPGSRTNFEGIYSTSGFDMLDVLTRVVTRPNPQINIGPVDMSCSFVVCDATKFDMPIIYCSDMFERLTGYSKHEILGRNCRFLQSPDGRVQPGLSRKYVDDEVIWQLKNAILGNTEAQTGLINYRKGGQPFMNMLTTIPILGADGAIEWFVGLQIDLVEHPGSIRSKKADGTISVHYQRALQPIYRTPEPIIIERPSEQPQTIGRDDVSAVLSTFGTGDSELTKRLWDKILLENTDDVVHVLSLKGLFLYLSPSSRKVLEYQPNELIGTSISSVCHPSDIVPVTRDLKDTTSDSSISIVYRVRRKHSGYTWFESHGCLHTEQGKGRKCIILVGRERPVYTLIRKEIDLDGGIGDNELWSKMSTSAMFLFVASNCRSLLDRSPEDLMGTSMQALMRPDSKQELGKALEVVRGGYRATVKHELHHRQGQVLQVETVLFPGDATAGHKPTFIVARTRFARASRSRHSLAARLKGSGSTPTDLGPNVTDGFGLTSRTSPRGPSDGERLETVTGSHALAIGNQDALLASEENVFDELKTTRSTSWQFELRQMQRTNKRLSEELQSLISSRKKRKRRKGAMELEKECANCHTRITSEWRRGPSGKRDLCNSCGLRYAKSTGRTGSGKGSGNGSSSAFISNGADRTKHTGSVSAKVEAMPSIDAQVNPVPRPMPPAQNPANLVKKMSNDAPVEPTEPVLFKPPSLISGLSPESAIEPP